jgi:hypothetical protein
MAFPADPQVSSIGPAGDRQCVRRFAEGDPPDSDSGERDKVQSVDRRGDRETLLYVGPGHETEGAGDDREEDHGPVRDGQGYKSAGRTVNTPPCGGFTARKCL